MKRVILIACVCVFLVGCGTGGIFDTYKGDDLFAMQNSITTGYPQCWSVSLVTNTDTEKAYKVYDELGVLRIRIILWTESGCRYDWYSEYTYY